MIAAEQKYMLTIEVNFTRNAVRAMPEALKRLEARKMVKMFFAIDTSMADRDIPDYLVSEPMIDRYLAIEPPQFCALTEFQDAVPDWERNIEALVTWKYLSDDLGKELADLYKTVRCHYLHSQPIPTLEQDCLRAIKAAYRLLDEILGLPARLFKIGSEITILAPSDPLVRAFYMPHATPV